MALGLRGWPFEAATLEGGLRGFGAWRVARVFLLVS